MLVLGVILADVAIALTTGGIILTLVWGTVAVAAGAFADSITGVASVTRIRS